MKRIIIILMLVFLFGCEDETKNNNYKEVISEEVSSEESTKETKEYDFSSYIKEASQISNMRNLTINIKGENHVTEYFNLCKDVSKNNIFSVTKSITAMLIGIAIDDGYIESVDDPISKYINLNEYGAEERLYDVTLKQIITMTGGYQWIQSQSNEYQTIKSKMDPLEFIFSKSMIFDPGEQFAYSNEEAYIATVILNNAVGKTPLEYATDKLFGPLGIENVRWTESRSGINYGGFDCHLSASDMEKIGLLMLGNGNYMGTQIISEDYMIDAMDYHVRNISGNRYDGNYGYYFWNGEKHGYKVVSCLGHGGQFITVVPDLELVITSSTFGAVDDGLAAQQFMDLEDLIINNIIPYVAIKQE